MVSVEYSYDNCPQEGEFGVVRRSFDSCAEAYSFAAQVLARAVLRNRNSPLCAGEPEDRFTVDLRITRQACEGQELPIWQATLLTIFFDGFEEHAMWYSLTDGKVYHC